MSVLHITKLNNLTPNNSILKNHTAVEPANNDLQLKSFREIIKSQLAKVNELEVEKEALQQKYIMGDKEISLPEIVVSMQKAQIATSFATETRNHMVAAYDKIMNMTI